MNKVIKVKCLKTIMKGNFIGCGAYEFCRDNNLMHAAFKKDEIYYTTERSYNNAIKELKKGILVGVLIVSDSQFKRLQEKYPNKSQDKIIESTKNYIGHYRQFISDDFKTPNLFIKI